ncbi:RNase3 domain-containing protein [Colletotrichum orchidophilum]|uniref:Dicer-like protein 1 n=1 Tax=Colletotrichum orchidophilum TaxID=1209926 RepID=A0A1G4B2S8_9PEZI|nr:RNase3 domain-containing protein [Colletotrichum orchidophilum]OHE95729.1 RNase3 domain-containing protein [Colletotrichum orchidophilum]
MEAYKSQRLGDRPSASGSLVDGLEEINLTPRYLEPLQHAQESHKQPTTTELGGISPATDCSSKPTSPSYSVAASSCRRGPIFNTDDIEEQDHPDKDENDDQYEDDDYRRWSLNPEKPRKISEKKRQDHAKFQSWVESNQTQVLEAASKTSKGPTRESVAYLVRENENRRIIQTPREYQIELFERAKQKNIIAVLDTGAGKTLIAALLLRHMLEKEVEDRALGKPKRIAFFLVDKVSLVFQQHAVLECNLEHNVARYCGDMVEEMWSREFWTEQFEKNMVIVCTAAILQKCLVHSYIRMDQINLLIFDEAHHTKKNHPYARIIKDFYIKEPEKEKRPKILGMTASPVDAHTDMKVATAQLECLLHSEIATVSEESLSMNPNMRKITEREIHYTALMRSFESDLVQKIRALVRSNQHFDKELQWTDNAIVELGPWVADRFWQLFLTDNTIARLENRTDITYSGCDGNGNRTAAVQKLRDVINGHGFRPATLSLDDVSSKVLQLWDELKRRYSEPTDYRCIVFVEMRLTAVLLADLFKQDGMKLPHLKPAALVGSQSTAGLASMSFKEQLLNITKFRRGEVNCIFSTQVAEEGIDIPACNMVMRFDLYKSVIQYIQSKGRARQQDSEYLSFIEMGNGRHSRAVAQATYDENILRRFCSALPEDKKIMGIDINASVMQGDLHYQTYTIKETGAKLTWMSSLEVLANFASSLRQSSNEVLAPEYVVTNQGQYFIAEVQLPTKSPILSKTGMPHKKKQAARCSAAFEMCKELIKKKFIDLNLRPVFTKKLPAMRNARLAISANKRAEYKMRNKPEIWSRVGPFDQLYVTILALGSPDALGKEKESKPLLLLSREKLPDLPPVPLFFGNNQQSDAMIESLPKPIKVSQEDSELLRTFTLRVFKDIFSKEYEAKVSDMPYFLAPTTHDHFTDLQNADGAKLVDWNHLRMTNDKEYLDWDDGTSDEFFKYKLVIDPYAGSRKFRLRGVRRDLKPMDPVPEGVPDPGHKPWRDSAVEKNIKEYSVSLWMKSRQKRTWRDTQPVVEAEVISLRRNLLDDFVEVTNEESTVCYLILEPLRVSTLPFETVAMAFTFPAIIHRMDQVMIALDLCRLLKLDIRPDLALEAVTKDSDNSDEHDAEKINFQGGMGNNYERLEFIGDTCLKMATTIALFTNKPDHSEFEHHVERMLLISNRNLLNKAIDRNLQEYVRSKSFSRRSWYPQGLRLIRGKQGTYNANHALADKSIADVCEALIGAAYLTYSGSNNFDMAIRAVSAMVNDKSHRMTSWADYYAGYNPPPWQLADATKMQQDVARQVKEKMGYEFKSPALLRSAFRHPSYPQAFEPLLPNYQRLEFLGDALLDMVCVDFLYYKFPNADPEWLTRHKSTMVSNRFLACLCVKLGLHRHILTAQASLLNQTQDFVALLKISEQNAREEAQQQEPKEATEGKMSDGSAQSQQVKAAENASVTYWQHIEDPPKYLSDVVEAYIGAVFVDSGYDYGQVRAFFEAHVRPFFTDMSLYSDYALNHPVTNVSHMLRNYFGCDGWRLMTSEVVPPVEAGAGVITDTQVLCGIMIHGQVCFHATAASGRYAKVAVAKMAIAKFSDMDRQAFKKEFACDCQGVEGECDTADHGMAA